MKTSLEQDKVKNMDDINYEINVTSTPAGYFASLHLKGFDVRKTEVTNVYDAVDGAVVAFGKATARPTPTAACKELVFSVYEKVKSLRGKKNPRLSDLRLLTLLEGFINLPPEKQPYLGGLNLITWR